MLCLVAAALGVAGCGGEDSRQENGADAFSAVERRAADSGRGRRAAPRWEVVAELSNRSSASRRVEIGERAIQWRARWRCRRGDFELAVDGETVARDACPGRGMKSAIETGPIRLEVKASAPWRLVVEQQVDTPLREPPLEAMRAPGADVLARGRFYPNERRGEGTASLYRLPSGRLALRLDGFDTSANTDLFVWLSEARRPRSTRQALRSRYVELALLQSTLGSQNYLLPPGFDAARAASVVIWCEPIRIAYTAATLAS